MAEHADAPEVTEAVERGASRRQVLLAAKRAAEPDQPPPEWTDDELLLRKRSEQGETVVANLRAHHVLIAWARATDRFVRVDRNTPWGNPFVTPDDGDRDTVVDHYRSHYWPFKPSLQDRAHELAGGKVLACWCAPALCHGDVLAEVANRC